MKEQYLIKSNNNKYCQTQQSNNEKRNWLLTSFVVTFLSEVFGQEYKLFHYDVLCKPVSIHLPVSRFLSGKIIKNINGILIILIFNGAETNCRIAHNLGILLMNSKCFAIYFQQHSYYICSMRAILQLVLPPLTLSTRGNLLPSQFSLHYSNKMTHLVMRI